MTVACHSPEDNSIYHGVEGEAKLDLEQERWQLMRIASKRLGRNCKSMYVVTITLQLRDPKQRYCIKRLSINSRKEREILLQHLSPYKQLSTPLWRATIPMRTGILPRA